MRGSHLSLTAPGAKSSHFFCHRSNIFELRVFLPVRDVVDAVAKRTSLKKFAFPPKTGSFLGHWSFRPKVSVSCGKGTTTAVGENPFECEEDLLPM